MLALISEHAATDADAARACYRALGFETVDDRPEDGFVRLRPGTAGIMPDELGHGRSPEALTRADRPFGRGVNLQIEIPALDPVVTALAGPGRARRPGPATRWYRAGAEEIGQRQLWVEDPDGDTLRFCENLGRRPAGGA